MTHSTAGYWVGLVLKAVQPATTRVTVCLKSWSITLLWHTTLLRGAADIPLALFVSEIWVGVTVIWVENLMSNVICIIFFFFVCRMNEKLQCHWVDRCYGGVSLGKQMRLLDKCPNKCSSSLDIKCSGRLSRL